MTIPTPTVIHAGYSDAVGCAYRRGSDQLLVVDAGAGAISALAVHSLVYTVLGTGYNAPSDIVLSADGTHAYVTEKPGSLLRVNLSSANRASAVVVASGLNGADQIALDEAHGYAYVAEFTASRVQKINLTTGVKTVAAAAGLFGPRGVLVTGDGRFLYVSDDTGKITRFDFATNTSTVIASGLQAPRHLVFADAGESQILFPVRNPTGTVMKLDLTASPPAVVAIAGPTDHDPYSLAVLSPTGF